MDSSHDQQCSNTMLISSEQFFSQESDIISSSDIDCIMDDLGGAHNLNIYFDRPGVPASSHYVNSDDFHNTCDSTHDENVQNCAINPSSPTGSLPCLEDYPGPYNFELLLDGSTSHKKSWIYSYTLNKVFIDVEKVLLAQFHLSAPAPGLRVRALLVYTTSEHLNQPVNRCTLHSLAVDPQRQAHSVEGECFCAQYEWAGHVLQTDNINAQYDYNPESERHSVVVPLEQLQAGSDVYVVPYKFTCKTSCPRGIQRRPMDVIFTLETPQCEVVGRQTFSVKICSCPKRDKEREEQEAEWFQKDRGLSEYTGKRSKTNHKTTKKLKPDITSKNCVDSQTNDSSNHQDFPEMVKRAEELCNAIQSLNNSIQSHRNSIQSLSNELNSRQAELTQLLVELGKEAVVWKLFIHNFIVLQLGTAP